ncbi:hypothetical protein CWO89_23830 [Bradyrhizobium sp. Leo170]|nr:hypothetical protein CWO89_23830 [Bradyrhizobium sp. Leo170]
MLAGLWGEGRAPVPLDLVPLATGQVLDAGAFTIGCFPIPHRDTDNFGFSFESKVRRHLRPDRLSALGVPDGPVRKELAEGRPVTLADGKTIDPEDVLGPPEGRKKLVIVGDTETVDGLAEHVGDADVLVIEATFLQRDASIARDYGHLTAAEAATLAATTGVRLLILTHISGRYHDEEILAEASKRFANTRVSALRRSHHRAHDRGRSEREADALAGWPVAPTRDGRARWSLGPRPYGFGLLDRHRDRQTLHRDPEARRLRGCEARQ